MVTKPDKPRQGLYRALQVVAPVRPGEAASALLLLLNIFVLLTSYYVLKVIREPLILAGGGGAELKAYASGGQAILLLLAVPAFGYLASRVNRINKAERIAGKKRRGAVKAARGKVSPD